MWRPSRTRRSVGVLALMLNVMGCTARRPVEPRDLVPERRVEAAFSPPRALELQTPTGVRQRREVGRLAGVVRAVRGDTVWVEGTRAWDTRGERLAGTPVEPVALRKGETAITAPQADPTATAVVVIGLLAAAFVGVAALVAEGMGDT